MTETTPTTEPAPPGDLPDDDLAAMLATGADYKTAGAAVGMSVRSVQRRMADPKFRARVDELKSYAAGRAVALLVDGMSEAAAELRRLVASASSEKVKLAAAKALLELAIRARTAEELERELRRVSAEVEALMRGER
jgi:hypothetical protein